jgi:preprotein translocase subunit SecG
MATFFTILGVISAVAVVVLVLIHSPKSEGMGAIGGAARTFGAQKGLESGLDRLTAVFATIFIISAIITVVLR